MNGAEKIKERILTDARSLHDKILDEARAQAKALLLRLRRRLFRS